MHTLKHRIISFISASFLGLTLISSPAHADEIKQTMMQMKKEYRSAMQSTTTNDMAQHVALLKSHASKAAHLTHDGSAHEQATYSQGIQELLASYNELEMTLQAGNLDQAKTMLEKIKDIQKNYHKKLGV